MSATDRAILIDLCRFQRGLCAYCSGRMREVTSFNQRSHDDLAATIDHMAPIAAGGKDEHKNRCAACRRCNNDKGPLDALTFLKLRHNPAALMEAKKRIRHGEMFTVDGVMGAPVRMVPR